MPRLRDRERAKGVQEINKSGDSSESGREQEEANADSQETCEQRGRGEAIYRGPTVEGQKQGTGTDQELIWGHMWSKTHVRLSRDVPVG